jgi:opacity protein-like surface antigen
MRIVIILALTLAFAGPAWAQPSADRGELFASLASAHIFRAEDRSFGNPVDIGVGVRAPIARSIGIEVEVNRALGLQAVPARCGVVGGCEGTAREGVLDATLATANVYVRFPHGRLEPFLIGGVGGLWTTSVNSLTRIRDGVGVMSEMVERDAGLAIGFGGGADVRLTRRLSVRPEVRVYDSTAMSRTNLAVIRTAVAVGYRW